MIQYTHNLQSALGSVITIIFALAITGCATPQDASVPTTDSQLEQLQGTGLSGLAATLSEAKSAEEAARLGDEASQSGNREEAILHYVRALEIEPKDPVTLYKIGVIHGGLGNVPLAALGFQMALKVDSDYVPAREALGLLLMRARNFDEAQEHLGRAVALDPKRWRSHNGLGIVADLKGDFEDAVKYYTAAIDLQPRSGMLMSNLGYSYYLQGDFANAQNSYERAITLEPRYFIARRNLAIMHVKFRQFDKALRLLAVNDDLAAAYNDLGYLCILAQEYAAARKYLKHAIRLSPTFYARAQENLAYLERRASSGAAKRPLAQQIPRELHRLEDATTRAGPIASALTPARAPTQASSIAPTAPITPARPSAQTIPLASPERSGPALVARSVEAAPAPSDRDAGSAVDENSLLGQRLRAADGWLRTRGNDAYTIQLMTVYRTARAELEQFLIEQKRRDLLEDTYVVRSRSNGGNQFYVLYKDFHRYSNAAKAEKEMPEVLRAFKPYIRNTSDFGA